MKKVIVWGIYFLICGTVITAAVMAGKSHDHCHECEIAIGEKGNVKKLAHWHKVILPAEKK